jgi:hypothetical protein
MTVIKATLEAAFRRLEQRLGIDREGRSVWVWLLPPVIGLATAVLVPFMPGLPAEMGPFERATLAIFGFVTMTVIASIYLISFDNDHNQQAPAEEHPARGDGDDPHPPPAPSGSPSAPSWLSTLETDRAGTGADQKVPAASGTRR